MSLRIFDRRLWAAIAMVFAFVPVQARQQPPAAQPTAKPKPAMKDGQYMIAPWHGGTRGFTLLFTLPVFPPQPNATCSEQAANSAGDAICNLPGVARAEFGLYRVAVWVDDPKAETESLAKSIADVIRAKKRINLRLMKTSGGDPH